MAERKERKLNWLERNLPEGLVVDAAWLTRRGYSTSLRSQYVSAGWLEQPTRGVYRRPRGSLSWQQVVISLQALLEFPVVVGGRTALELQGYAHYLRQQAKEVLLYGPKRPPKWVNELQRAAHFAYRNDGSLFRNAAVTRSPANLNWTPGSSAGDEWSSHALTVQSWGQWDWPLTLSSPERAVLELLDESPIMRASIRPTC